MRAIFEWHPSGSSGSAVAQLIVEWQIGRPVAWLAMNLVPLAEEWSEWHSSGTLALNWLSLPWDESEWHSIGLLQIGLSLRIWLKSRPLIGRELGMLASDWSRGPFENVQRGYPYDPEPVPLEQFWSSIQWKHVPLKLCYPWLTLEWLQWHSSGLIGSALAYWQTSGMIDHEFGFIGKGVVWVASKWHSGAQLNYVKSEEFISGLAPRSFPSIEGNRIWLAS